MEATSSRPQPARRDTTNELLSYYLSPLPDQTAASAASHPQATSVSRQLSLGSTSTSSSNYTPESSDSEYSVSDHIPRSKLHGRRISTPSPGGAARRRLHIVETDPADSGNSTSLHSRRRVHTGLDGILLVAPPDSDVYAHLNPPATAPLPAIENRDNHSQSSFHTRAASDIILYPAKHRSGNRSHVTEASIDRGISKPTSLLKAQEDLPAGSRSHSASPVKSGPSSSLTSTETSQPCLAMPPPSITKHQIVTPAIGESKEISVPVAAPVIVSLDTLAPEALDRSSHRLLSSKKPSAFLQYQPGVHSSAGPLPEPPKASTIIMPPRDSPPPAIPAPPQRNSSGYPRREPREQTSSSSPAPEPHLRHSRRNSPISSSPANSTVFPEPAHQREGAFPPSVILSSNRLPSSTPTFTTPLPPVSDDQHDNSSSHGRDRQSLDSSHSISVHSVQSTPESRRRSTDIISASGRQTSPSRSRSPPSSYHGHTGNPSSHSHKTLTMNFGQGLPSGLSASMKRFSSLPRTPSGVTSIPSPPPRTIELPPRPRRRAPQHKLKSKNPPAMSCADITTKRSPLERCRLYAQKINELYIYDCGLSDWVIEQKIGFGSTKPASTAVSRAANLAVPGQPRQISRGSMMTQATGSTFPQRPDAVKATDLMVGSQQTEQSPMPSLPYPSLAQTPRSTNSTLPSPTTSTRPLFATIGNSTKSGGFFSSLGRKTSVKRDKASSSTPSPVSSGGKLLKAPPSHHVTKTPASTPMSPSVPGGPRAPPSKNRPHRSHTYMAGSPSTTVASRREGSGRRSSIIGRRPSITVQSSSPNAEDIAVADQVAKLANLLPHADKTVLAAYLKRTGEPMLAIGQYLEDEKQGRLRRD